MKLAKGIFLTLFFLMMITGFIGLGKVCFLMFFLCFVWSFFLLAIEAAGGKYTPLLGEETQNQPDAAPVRSFPARIIRMHREKTKSFDYYITFQAPDGSQKELAVDENTYGIYNLGETGNLIFLYDFCLSFTHEGCPLPAVYPQNAQYLPVMIVHKRKKPSPCTCYITFETPECPNREMRVSPQFFETCYEGETGNLICQNGAFLCFDPAVAEILDPALFVRQYPEPEQDPTQMNGF